MENKKQRPQIKYSVYIVVTLEAHIKYPEKSTAFNIRVRKELKK
jgi:hypothetical protein